jgi:hypothetical protein
VQGWPIESAVKGEEKVGGRGEGNGLRKSALKKQESTDALPFLVPEKRILTFFPPFFAMRQVRKDKAYWNDSEEGVALNSNHFVLSKESVSKAADLNGRPPDCKFLGFFL